MLVGLAKTHTPKRIENICNVRFLYTVKKKLVRKTKKRQKKGRL